MDSEFSKYNGRPCDSLETSRVSLLGNNKMSKRMNLKVTRIKNKYLLTEKIVSLTLHFL